MLKRVKKPFFQGKNEIMIELFSVVVTYPTNVKFCANNIKAVSFFVY